MNKRWMVFATGLFVAIAMVAMLAGCGEEETTEPETVERSELILATTTSTQDSGLLDEWVPMFEDENPYTVKVIAVGSGAAMEMGREGECDVMLVHSPAAEEEMVAELVTRMKRLASDPDLYKSLNRDFKAEYDKLYSFDDYLARIRMLALREFELQPTKDPLAKIA